MARQRQQGQRRAAAVEWDFFSFPFAWGIAIGGLAATVTTAFIGPGLPFVVTLFAFSFGLSHLVFHGLRRRTIDREMARKEEEELERRILAQRQHEDETGISSRRARKRRRGRRDDR